MGRQCLTSPTVSENRKTQPELKNHTLEVHGDVFSYGEREYDSDTTTTQPGKLWRLAQSMEDRKVLRQYSRTDGRYALFIKQRPM